MSTKKLFGIVTAALLAGSLYAADVVLNPEHPDRYVVVKGDTLWDISSMFLRDPSGNALEFKAFRDQSQIFARARD